MIERETWAFNLALNDSMQNWSPFVGVSLLFVGYFLQLPPVNQKDVFMKPRKRSYRSFNGWLGKNSNCIS